MLQLVESGRLYLIRVAVGSDVSAETEALVARTVTSLEPTSGPPDTTIVGRDARNLLLPSLVGMAVDDGGRAYLADYVLDRVIVIDASGTVSRVIGNGHVGDAGDGGPAADAQLALSPPAGLAVDPAGNLYIADQTNHKIRRVSPDGTITTYAGTGAQQVGADGLAARDTAVTAERHRLRCRVEQSVP